MRAGIGDHGESRVGRRRHKPGARCGSAGRRRRRRCPQRRIEPHRRLVVAQRQQQRGRRREQRRGRRQSRMRASAICAGPRHARPCQPEHRLRVAHRIAEGRLDGGLDWHRRSILSAHQCEEIDLGGRRLGALAASAAARRAMTGATRLASSSRAAIRRPAQAHRRSPRACAALRARRAGRKSRSRRSRSRTAARVTVASPRLNGGPPPPMRPRSMTRPVWGGRSSSRGRQLAQRRKRRLQLGLGSLRARAHQRLPRSDVAAARCRSPSEWSCAAS